MFLCTGVLLKLVFDNLKIILIFIKTVNLINICHSRILTYHVCFLSDQFNQSSILFLILFHSKNWTRKGGGVSSKVWIHPHLDCMNHLQSVQPTIGCFRKSNNTTQHNMNRLIRDVKWNPFIEIQNGCMTSVCPFVRV